MLNSSDAELLRQYARHKSEVAFGEIVRRYANLVYSAACRQTNDVEEARDVAQMVFADLARKAGSIGAKSVLAGWLYRGVRLQTLELRRNDLRRRRRERQAMDPLQTTSEPGGDWGAVRPLLDDAMASLADKDRDALLLRFFKNESLASLGGTMGISEDAAQKRVSRALGKLREFLAQRGITTSEAALSATLAANAIETAPGGAAAVWISGALAGAPLSSSSVLTLLNMKTAFLIAALAGRFLVLTVLHVRSLRRVDKLQAALQAQAKDIAALRAEIEQLNARPTVTEEDARTREIARLRAKIDRLRTDLDAEKARKTISTPQSEMRGPSAVADAIPPQVVIQSAFLTAPTAAFSGAATGLMTADQAASMVTALTNHPDVNLIFLPRVTTLCGRQAHVAATDSVPIGSGSTNIGLSLDVLPECSTNSGLVSLQFFLVGTHLTAQSEIEQITTNASIAVPDGNALVLTMGIPGDGPWFAGDPTNSEGSRALIMVLTPTLIDPAGNRLHPADTNDSPQTVTANPSGVFSAPGPLPSP